LLSRIKVKLCRGVPGHGTRSNQATVWQFEGKGDRYLLQRKVDLWEKDNPESRIIWKKKRREKKGGGDSKF